MIAKPSRQRPRCVAIVTGHFPPSNLAGVHRSRLWAQHLPEFGWEPIIVTAHWRHYEERLDWDLATLVPEELEVIRCWALPTRPLRLVGDIGIRALPGLYASLARLLRTRPIDFLLFTLPSNFVALLGRPLHHRFGVPYGVDYQDPWVHVWPGTERILSKAWISHRLSALLEPWAVCDARLVTGISRGYFADMLARNPHLEQEAVTAAMPIGGSEKDFEAVRASSPPTFLFDPADGNVHLVYAGAMLPRAYTVLERLFGAIRRLTESSPALTARLRLHFVGTGKSPDDPQGHNVKPYIERFSLERWVDEHPERIGYVDVLSHLVQASAILVVGSTERHYSPSKVFQAVQSRRPVLAILHEESTAVPMLRDSRAASPVTFADGALPNEGDITAALEDVLRGRVPNPDAIDWTTFDAFSARSSARRLAEALEQALDLEAPRATAGHSLSHSGPPSL